MIVGREEGVGGGGGGRSGTQKFVYQKWPHQIFPTANLVFSHDGLGGGGGGWDPPSSQGPPMVPAKGDHRGPFKLNSSWQRSKILAVSLKYWKGRKGGGRGV